MRSLSALITLSLAATSVACADPTSIGAPPTATPPAGLTAISVSDALDDVLGRVLPALDKSGVANGLRGAMAALDGSLRTDDVKKIREALSIAQAQLNDAGTSAEPSDLADLSAIELALKAADSWISTTGGAPRPPRRATSQHKQ